MQTASPLINSIENTRPWYKQRWPWLLMLGPIVVILAGAYTTWLAFSRQDALVVDDYYKQGKAINQDLRRDRVAAKLGLAFNIRYDAAAGAMRGTLKSVHAPMTGKIWIHLAHATLPEKDLKFAVQPNQQGEFSIPLPMLEKTRWLVLVEGEQRDWRLTSSWKWPQQQIVDIKADLAPTN